MCGEYGSAGKNSSLHRAPPLLEGGSSRKPRTALFGFFYPIAGLPLFRSWMMDYVFELD